MVKKLQIKLEIELCETI